MAVEDKIITLEDLETVYNSLSDKIDIKIGKIYTKSETENVIHGVYGDVGSSSGTSSTSRQITSNWSSLFRRSINRGIYFVYGFCEFDEDALGINELAISVGTSSMTSPVIQGSVPSDKYVSFLGRDAGVPCIVHVSAYIRVESDQYVHLFGRKSSGSTSVACGIRTIFLSDI